MFWSALAVAVSVLTAVQFIPQTIDAVKKDDLDGISMTTFSLLILTTSMWIAHGIHTRDNAIVFANIIIDLCAALIVYRKIITNKK